MKTSDVIVLGAGIIGLALAIELRRRGFHVMLIERGEPGLEASHAAAGMLAAFDPEHPAALRDLAIYSWEAYPGFLELVQEDSGISVPVQENGAILVGLEALDRNRHTRPIDSAEAASLEPALGVTDLPMALAAERRLDPRVLLRAMIAAARHKNIEFITGTEVLDVSSSPAGLTVTANHAKYAAGAAVNCCGAWVGTFGPLAFPARPIKGQIFSVLPQSHNLLRRTVHGAEVYLVPRADGRIIIGATAEDVGFDKRVEPEVIQRLHKAAAIFVPAVGEARILEAWSGLRPATTDNLPIMGATPLANYYVSTGHFRNGILLAPASARIVADTIVGAKPEIDATPFRAVRFENLVHAA